MAFAEVGCKVCVVCPGSHPILKTSVVSGAWRYSAFRPGRVLEKAIKAASPQLIVPCDEAAAADLHALASSTKDPALRESIESSTGSANSFAVSSSRTALHELAAKLKIPVPRASPVGAGVPLAKAIAEVGLPAFLKKDGSSGGRGVYLIKTLAESDALARKLSSPPSVARAVKRAMVDGDMSLLRDARLRRQAKLSLQRAVAGTEANSSIFCWRGKVMASITVEVVAESMKYGPSTVLRRIENAEIDRATAAIAKRLELSGMHGFDFVIEEATGQAKLIEINARPTQTSHLALGKGSDLVAAARAALTGDPLAERTAVTRKDVIALFPAEWLRDPKSQYLNVGYHDIPQTEPKLLCLCLSRPNLAKRLLTVRGWKELLERNRGSEQASVRDVERAPDMEPKGFRAKPAALEVEQLP